MTSNQTAGPAGPLAGAAAGPGAGPATGVDLTDPGVFAAGYPHDFFTHQRREEPVFEHRGRHVPLQFWAVCRYDDIVTVSRDAATFSSARRGVLLEDAAGGSELMMLNQDPPRHTRLRNLVARMFTPKQMRIMEPHVRAAATRVVDAVVARGDCDFVTDVAAELPLVVIADLLGVPQEDRHRVFDWSNRMVGREDPEYGSLDGAAPSGADGAAAMSAAGELFVYASALGEDHLRNPRDDIVSTLLHAEVDGERLTHEEFIYFFLLLAVAGNETTRNLISGGLLAFAENPDQWRRLLDDRSLLPGAVEEMLRWVSPVISFRRTATRDTEIRGVPIAEGDNVVVFYGSGNRDEDVFADPFRFDIGRSPNDHLAFGGRGPHHCLGANLARLEIRLMFEQIAERMPGFALAGPPVRLRSNLINGIKHLPVEFAPGPRAL